MISPGDALRRLREGNRRFAAGGPRPGSTAGRERLGELLAGQSPFAVILGCSDSRVPPEIVFDQGLGDLFVIRVAGNIASPPQAASFRFAVEQFGIRLGVVLGHTRCGAIQAALEEGDPPIGGGSGRRDPIVEWIRPSLAGAREEGANGDPGALMGCAVRANIRRSAEHLRRSLGFPEGANGDGELLVVGAEYSLETGIVDFFDGAPEPARIPGSRPGSP